MCAVAFESIGTAQPQVLDPQHGGVMWVQGVDGGGEALDPLVLIDTAGCGMEEAADEDSDSRKNEGEAKVTSAHPALLYQKAVCGSS